MLMCSERQRWCIRWSVELLWVSLCCCRVSSSRQTLLSGLCVGVSQGTGFSATKPRVRASSRCSFSILYDMQGPVLKNIFVSQPCLSGNAVEHFIGGSQCSRIFFLKKKGLNQTSINRLFSALITSECIFAICALVSFKLRFYLLFK